MDTVRTYSTAQVANRIQVAKKTLLRWLYSGKLAEPKRRKNGGQDIRIWSERDLERARRFKEQNFGKGKGPRPKK
jgi:predicted site-specific integrase-resolvase